MTERKPIHTWLTDMDGVLVHEEDPIPGAAEFIEALKSSGLKYLLLTNNSIFTPRDLRARSGALAEATERWQKLGRSVRYTPHTAFCIHHELEPGETRPRTGA